MSSPNTLKASLLLLTLAIMLTGCAGIEPPTTDEVMKEPLGKGSLRVGMSKEQVISIWGKPDEIQTNMEDKKRWKGTREVWIYHAQLAAIPVDADYLSQTKKLYFDGNNLTNIGG
ncbi:MAG: hypothetical protein PHP46_00465 [Candidatus Omnitrophica bacterium]|nr:hypothetical protein [Candidatus Omnitrophota bacterium]